MRTLNKKRQKLGPSSVLKLFTVLYTSVSQCLLFQQPLQFVQEFKMSAILVHDENLVWKVVFSQSSFPLYNQEAKVFDYCFVYFFLSVQQISAASVGQKDRWTNHSTTHVSALAALSSSIRNGTKSPFLVLLFNNQ